MGGDDGGHLGRSFGGRGELPGAQGMEVALVDEVRKLRWVGGVELAGDGRLPDEQ